MAVLLKQRGLDGVVRLLMAVLLVWMVLLGY